VPPFQSGPTIESLAGRGPPSSPTACEGVDEQVEPLGLDVHSPDKHESHRIVKPLGGSHVAADRRARPLRDAVDARLRQGG
jgi:hypothetical protein